MQNQLPPVPAKSPRDGGDIAIVPLRKKTLTGGLYVRAPTVEALLVELSALSQDELIARAAISRRTDDDYVPSECLVYFVRTRGREEPWFERLYKILAERVLRRLPKAKSGAGRTESTMREAVRDKVLGGFVDLLLADRTSYNAKLDFFEVRFDGALAKLRCDAQKQAWRDENRSKTLEYDEVSGEISAEIERAAGYLNPFATSELDDPVYRSRLDAAIDDLPAQQKRIVEMIRQGFPIDSKEPGVMTISKALGRSEKTVRTHRDKAFAALRAALIDGENP